jgi:small subunit ribosomal protein S4
MEKQKAKYTYGFSSVSSAIPFEKAAHRKGVTGDVLLQMLESRLDNTVFRMGFAPTRRAARQLVSHKHIVVNGVITNIPSFHLRPGDVIAVRGKSQHMEIIQFGTARRSSQVSLVAIQP